MSDLTLKKVQYKTATGDLHDSKVYFFWKERWPKLVQKLGSEISDNEFFVQDRFTTLELDDEIIGMHLLKTYTSSSGFTEPYFEEYPIEVRSRFQKYSSLQTLQYFIVDENFSVQNTLVNFPAILLSLSMKQQDDLGLDATIGIGRKDIPVTSLCLKVGMKEVAQGTMHNVPVSYLICEKPAAHPKGDVVKWVEHFWANRIEEHFGQNIKSA